VSKIGKNQLILVCVKNNITNKFVNDIDIKMIGDNIIKPIIITSYSSYDGILDNIKTLDYNESGYMIYDKTREYRTRYMSNEYKKVELLLQNTPYILKTLTLLSEKQLIQYLNYYPENNSYLNELSVLSRRFVGSLFYYYVQVKVKKIYTEIPLHIKKQIFNIHNIYLSRCKTLSKEHSKISHRIVKAYFHNLDNKERYRLIIAHKNSLENK
jgi:hypothetical protein